MQWRRTPAALLILIGAVAALADEPVGYGGFPAPGMEPEIFAPGVISTDGYEFAVTFMPDMSEIYLTRRVDPAPNRILVSRVEDGRLLAPGLAPFSRPSGEYEACIAPNGSSICFSQGRQIRRCRREGDRWSAAETLPAEVNYKGAMAIWLDADGNYYFTRRGALVVARREGDGWREAESLGPHFEREAGASAHGYVAPDASFVIFDARFREDCLGQTDLYVSFADEGGGWTEPRNLAEVNTSGTEMCASVSPDGRFLFFSREGDIWWVDAGVIERYR